MVENKLSPEDQQRVDQYLASPVHQIERKPFKPWRLLAMLLAFLTVMSVISYFIAQSHGIV